MGPFSNRLACHQSVSHRKAPHARKNKQNKPNKQGSNEAGCGPERVSKGERGGERGKSRAMGECVRLRYLSALAAEACREAALAMLRHEGEGGRDLMMSLSLLLFFPSRRSACLLACLLVEVGHNTPCSATTFFFFPPPSSAAGWLAGWLVCCARLACRTLWKQRSPLLYLPTYLPTLPTYQRRALFEASFFSPSPSPFARLRTQDSGSNPIQPPPFQTPSLSRKFRDRPRAYAGLVKQAEMAWQVGAALSAIAFAFAFAFAFAAA